MRKNLLSLVALAGAMFVSTSAFAQWAEPTAPALQEVNATEVESGKAYFIKNVGAGQFITGANNWSTQISLTQAGINSDTFEGLSPALAIYVADSTATGISGNPSGVSLRLFGTYRVYGAQGGRDFTNTYLFRDSEEWGFMDHGTQAKGYIWKITKAESGFYYIQTAEGDSNYPDAATQYAGWDNSLGEIESDPETGELLDGSVSTAVQFNLTGELESECIEWMFIPAEEFFAQEEAYNYRVKLYEKYLEVVETAEAEGLDVNMSDAEAIYNNPNATIAELESAIADLAYQVNVAIFKKELDGASPEDPIEATSIVLVNPAFEDGGINGWNCTFISGQTANNVGFQGASYTNNGTTLTEVGSALNDDDQPAYMSRFFEVWKPCEQNPHHLGDGDFSQTVYGLPNGIYKLTCDIIAVHQGGGYYPNPVDGVKLFVSTDNGKEFYQEVATNNMNPEHFSLQFTCPEGVKAMSFGLKTENTTANWIAADNFRIYYYGEAGDMVPEMLILMEQVKDADESGYTTDTKANAEILSNYLGALDAAKAIVALGAAATSEQCENAASVLKSAFNAIKQSFKDYIKLQGYIEEATDLVSKCSDAGFSESSNAVNELVTEWRILYNKKTATKVDIDVMAGVAHDTMMEAIGDADIPEGTDLTFLLSNPHFTQGTTSNPIGWIINSGSMGELRAATHNIETWHKTFDISQTIANMPAGVYDITLQGFVRHDGAKTDGTWLYGGISKAYLIDLDNDITQKVTEPIWSPEDGKPQMGDGNYDRIRGITEDGDGNPLYQCDGMTGAYYWFQETNPKTGELFYTNHVQLILDKKGDLTIGIHTEATEDWVIFDNFTIKYAGMTTAPMIATLNSKLEEFAGLLAGENTRITKKAEELGTQLPEEAQAAINADDAEQIITLIKKVDEAMDYVKDGNIACDALISLVDEYNSYAMDVVSDEGLEPTDKKFPAMLDNYAKYDTFTNDFTEFADNDAVNAAIQALRDGWVPYILSAATEATATEPVDVTLAVANANFVNFAGETSVAGWTEAENKFSTGNIQAGVADFYIQNFDLSQTINGLTPGYYMVTLDGFYRAGYPAAAAEAQIDGNLTYNAIMYATSSLDNKTKKLVDVFAGAQETAFGVSGEITASYLIDGEPATRYIPNLREAAATYFESGNYTNSINVCVGNDGNLTIGLKKDTLIDGDWTTFNNWKLYYLGPVNGIGITLSNELSIEPGHSEIVEIGLINKQTDFVAFQMDMTLPEGISIDKEGCSLSSRITDDEQKLIIGKLDENTYRLTSSSLSLTPISGTKGTLLTLKLNATKGSVGGQATISNIRFSTTESEKIIMDDVTFNISVNNQNWFNLTYMVDGEVYKTESIAEATALTPIAEPTKVGYTFSGWSELPKTMPANDVVITGSFTVNSYSLIYMVDGSEYKKVSVDYGATIIPEANPTKVGYTFSGWSDIPAIMPAQEVTVTGSFTINSYTITYKVDGETYSTSTATYGSTLEPFAVPEKEGYTFSGWSEIPSTMPAKNLVITGSFTINKYNLTYKVNGQTYKTAEVEYGASITPETEPTKEGCSFSGWSEIPQTMPARDLTVTGTFTINKYTVTWMIDEEVYKTEEVYFGSAISAPSVPNRDGYNFSWEFYPETMPAGDLTIKGVHIQMAIDVKLNKEEITLKEGRNEQLVATVSSEYSGYKDVVWTTTNEQVVNVDATGNVTALNAGEAWVVAVSKDFANAKDSCKVTVKAPITDWSVEVEAKSNTWAILEAIGIEDARDVVYLTIKGTINGYDVMAMRNRMPNLQVLDLSESRVVANDFKYYDKFYTKNDVITAYFVPKNVREIILPKNIKSIDGSAFRDCSKLNDIVLPENITRIGEHTFDGCSSLKGVNIPKSVTSIEDYAFKGCETLTEIRLPAYLKDIGDNAFDGCTSLKNIYALMSDIVPIGQHSFNDYENQTLYVPEFLFNKYFLDARWNQFLDIQTMEINPGDYEVFTTNSDTEMSEDDQRIPHKEDGEAIDASIQREGSFTVQGEEPQDFATVELISDGEGRSGSLIGDDDGEEQGNVVVNDLVYRVSVEAETEFQYTPPVDLNVDKDFEYPEGQYKWWYFDGSDRARLGSSGRKPLDGKILKAHQGYVFMAQRTGILVIHLGKTAVGGDRSAELQDNDAEEAQNQGWNFMGNPYASYYDMSECTNTSPITVWNAAQLIYEALRPGDDDFYLQPFQAFYVQKQDEVQGLKFDAVRRKSYRKSVEEKEERRALRRAKGVNPERRFIDLYIEASGQQADHTRLVANASAKAEYEVGVDAAKFMSEKAAAQIYTIESGVEMAINERPLSGSLPLGYTAAKAGRLTIGASRMDAPLVLVDRQTGVTCDLSENAYEFTTTEGTFNNRFLIRAQGDDGIGALAEKTGVLIAIREGGLAVGGAEGKEIQVYSIDGKAVASQSDNGFISLKPNIYIVGVDGITAKIRIRK